jgi:hypothetical protein
MVDFDIYEQTLFKHDAYLQALEGWCNTTSIPMPQKYVCPS